MLRSRYGLGLVPGKPSDFMPCCTAAMFEKSCGSTDSQFGSPTGVYDPLGLRLFALREQLVDRHLEDALVRVVAGSGRAL